MEHLGHQKRVHPGLECGRRMFFCKDIRNGQLVKKMDATNFYPMLCGAGQGDDVDNSDRFYHWGSLLGYINLMEK